MMDKVPGARHGDSRLSIDRPRVRPLNLDVRRQEDTAT
jgi:hypothetical protein